MTEQLNLTYILILFSLLTNTSEDCRLFFLFFFVLFCLFVLTFVTIGCLLIYSKFI